MKHRAMIAVAVAGALVSVLLGIAAQKRLVPSEEQADPRLAAVDRALATGNLPAAQRAWHDMYVQALEGRDWQELVSVADGELRIARRVGGRWDDGSPRARELYLVALFRARAQGSRDGVLRVAQRFAAVGDREAAAMALRLVDTTAPPQAETPATAVPDTVD